MNEAIKLSNSCAHGKWDFISMWQVMNQIMVRRKCVACGYLQDGEVTNWEDSPNYQLSKA